MSMSIGNKKGPKSDINITPYIDILLVLLIIFMVVTPIRQQDLKVKAPQQTIAPPPPEIHSDAIVLTVQEHGQLAINQMPTNYDVLGQKLREIYSARTNRNLFISANRELPYSDVVKVIDISKGAGVGEIGLIELKN